MCLEELKRLKWRRTAKVGHDLSTFSSAYLRASLIPQVMHKFVAEEQLDLGYVQFKFGLDYPNIRMVLDLV
eukprot:SAG11_NODE_197_length_12691_cov_20.904145_9_plen_71_part_00